VQHTTRVAPISRRTLQRPPQSGGELPVRPARGPGPRRIGGDCVNGTLDG